MRSMEEAPVDGTRILILTKTFGFDSRLGKYVETGEKWVEARFVYGRFEEWCGNPKTFSTGVLHPLAWAPLPS